MAKILSGELLPFEYLFQLFQVILRHLTGPSVTLFDEATHPPFQSSKAHIGQLSLNLINVACELV